MLDLGKNNRVAILRAASTAVCIGLITFAVSRIGRASHVTAFPRIFSAGVLADFSERLPRTLELVAVSFCVASIVGFGCALISNGPARAPIRGLGFILRSIPFFCLALILQLIFAVHGWLPSAGYAGTDRFDLTDRLSHLILPAGLLALFQLPSISDYFERSLEPNADGRRTSIVDIVAGLALTFAAFLPNLISATFITEIFFAWPGEARLLNESSAGIDAGLLLFSALFVLAVRYVAARVAVWRGIRI